MEGNRKTSAIINLFADEQQRTDERKDKVVFLDRDGVICRNQPNYVRSWEEFVFFPRAKEALRKLKEAGLRAVIVSNQSCINRGIVSMDTVDEINRQMLQAVAEAGGGIERVYTCPHRLDEGCDCRKPRTGLFRQAAEELNIDLHKNYFVGDALSDILAGKTIGAVTILALTGLEDHETPLQELREAEPDFIAEDIGEAVDWILDAEKKMEK